MISSNDLAFLRSELAKNYNTACVLIRKIETINSLRQKTYTTQEVNFFAYHTSDLSPREDEISLRYSVITGSKIYYRHDFIIKNTDQIKINNIVYEVLDVNDNYADRIDNNAILRKIS